MKKLLIPFFLFTATLALDAQKNYMPGYAVTNSGDTIRGYVDYRNWAKNPRSIKFKRSPEAEVQEFGTDQIKRFFVNDEYYQRAIVGINERKFDMNEVTLEVEPKYWNDTAFLLVIVEGKKSLYHIKLADREDYFFYKEKDTFPTFEFSKYIRVINEKRYIGKNTRYVGQMIEYLKDCPSVQERISKTNYTLSAIRKAYDEYYKCVMAKPDYEINKIKPVELGVLAGTSLTYLKYKSSAHEYLASLNFPGSVNFSTGIFADFIIPRNFQRWSAYNELNLTSYTTTAEYTDFVHENNYTVVNMSIGNNYIKFMSMIRYRYPIHKIFVFVNGGLSMGFAFTYTDQTTSTQYFYEQVRTWEDTGYNNRNFEFGCAAGLGIKFWHFTFETRYDKPFYPGTSSPTNRYYFLLGYTF